jgi:hypothetical protein
MSEIGLFEPRDGTTGFPLCCSFEIEFNESKMFDKTHKHGKAQNFNTQVNNSTENQKIRTKSGCPPLVDPLLE